METKLYVAKEFEDSQLPTRNNDTDAGWDLYCYETTIIPANSSVKVKTGVRITCDEGYWWTTRPRSSMGFIKQIDTFEGTMDAHYTGDTTVRVYNHTDTMYTINKGDRFCQVVVYPLPKTELVEISSVSELEEKFSHGRGNNGWGSSGK